MEDTIKWIDNKKKQFSVYKGARREGNESVSDDDDTDALEVFPQWTVTCSPKNYQTCLLSTSSSSSAALKIIVYNAGCSVYCMIVFMPTRCTLIPKEDVAKTTLIFPSGIVNTAFTLHIRTMPNRARRNNCTGPDRFVTVPLAFTLSSYNRAFCNGLQEAIAAFRAIVRALSRHWVPDF